MSERSFAAWSVGVALVFAAVVPEPGKSPAPAESWQAKSAAPLPAAKPVLVDRTVRSADEQQAFLRLLSRPGADFARADVASPKRINASAHGVLPK